MTAVDDRPITNGHISPIELPSQPISQTPPEEHPEPAPQPLTEAERVPVENGEVTRLRHRLANRRAERELAHEFVEVDSDDVFDEVRDEDEQHDDHQVARRVRRKRRTERLRAGKAAVRRARTDRIRAVWDDRAERTRARILDPARTLGADHRRWVASSVALSVLLAGGVGYMSRTVHHGLVGTNGTWLAYLVEPMASVLLIVSLLAQFTGRQRGVTIPKGMIFFDLGIALASLTLMTVPWGLRYGWDAGSLTAHILVPALITAAVVGWHLASGIYSQTIANSKQDPTLRDRLALLRAAIHAGELPVDVSANQVVKYLRANLPGGIGHEAARGVARSFLGY